MFEQPERLVRAMQQPEGGIGTPLPQVHPRDNGKASRRP